MTKQQVVRALLNHKAWVRSRGKDGTRADLREIDFTSIGIDFSKYTFKDAFLANATMSGLDLARCELNGAYLVEANLRGARFCHADLSGAFLIEADLREADLSGADVRRADFSGAKLEGVKWDQCVMSETIFDHDSLLQLPESILQESAGRVFLKHRNWTIIVRRFRPTVDAYDASVGLLAYFAKILRKLGYQRDTVQVRVEPSGDEVIFSVDVRVAMRESVEDHVAEFLDVLSGTRELPAEYGEHGAELRRKLKLAWAESALNAAAMELPVHTSPIGQRLFFSRAPDLLPRWRSPLWNPKEIKALARACDTSLKELAKQLHVSERAVTTWASDGRESGIRATHKHQLDQLLNKLDDAARAIFEQERAAARTSRPARRRQPRSP